MKNDPLSVYPKGPAMLALDEGRTGLTLLRELLIFWVLGAFGIRGSCLTSGFLCCTFGCDGRDCVGELKLPFLESTAKCVKIWKG